MDLRGARGRRAIVLAAALAVLAVLTAWTVWYATTTAEAQGENTVVGPSPKE